MYGAVLGNIIGSPFEFDANNVRSKEFPLLSEASTFNEDTVMTLAVAEGLLNAGREADDVALMEAVSAQMRRFGREFPLAGYGMDFALWLADDEAKAFGAKDSGAAVRVSSAAWLFQEDFERMRQVARLTAAVTHNDEEGIRAADAAASVIFLAIHKVPKEKIYEFLLDNFDYDLATPIEEIRKDYQYTNSAEETMPVALRAFFEGNDFEDVIRTAVSAGGDSDTIAAIAGAMAEAQYGVPAELVARAREILPDELVGVIDRLQAQLQMDEKARERDADRRRAWETALEEKRPEPGQALHGPQDLEDRNNPAAVFGNEPIEQAIGVFHQNNAILARAAKDKRPELEKQAQLSYNVVLESLRRRMDEGGRVLIPVVDVERKKEEKGITQNFQFQAVKTKNGRLWQPAFTSQAQYAKGNGQYKMVLSYSMQAFLHRFLLPQESSDAIPERISGVVFNPFGEAVFIPREAIAAIFEVNRRQRGAEGRHQVTVAHQDLSVVKIDAIVCAVDQKMNPAGEVSARVRKAAGQKLAAACRKIGSCPVGGARIAPGGELPARFVLHTAGPVWSGREKDLETLASCYRSCLDLALVNACHAVAFPPLFAGGTYGFPVMQAAQLAFQTVTSWLQNHPDVPVQVVFCCEDKESYGAYRAIAEGIQKAREQKNSEKDKDRK